MRDRRRRRSREWRDGGAVDVGRPVDARARPEATGADATLPRCGNGLIETATGEVCDDRNTASGDGCSGSCSSVEFGGAHAIEDPATHHCYWRSTDVINRLAAINAWAAQAGRLFRWTNAAERDFVYPTTLGAVGGRVWIGLQLVGGTGTWDDGGAAADVNFRSGEPSGDGPCVEWGPTTP